nr:hypothetical protein N8D75_06575 [Curtobacterium flaccumfaciens]
MIVAVLVAWSTPVTFAVTTRVFSEMTTVRDDRVTRLDGTGGDLGQERLVRHVRQRVHHDDLGFALAKVLLELPCGVETGVTAADDEDLGHGG